MFRNRASWLDHIVYNFQHHWETNPQYRAAVSGVVGLVLLVTMCACTGVVSAATSAALAGIGLGGGGAIGSSGGGNLHTGTNSIKHANTFPTSTVVLNPGSMPGISQLPNSNTPAPHPTATPTDTPVRGSGGPGGPVTTCNGAQSSASWVLNPCPLVHAQNGTLTIVDKKHPGASTNVVIDFCSASSCAQVYPPNAGYKLDGNGMETISFTVPAEAANSTTSVSGFISITGGPTMSIAAAPVQ
ncbi:MAG: hypothetical protein ACXWQR_09830 [Ktedonobacterales bacterium]